MLLPGRRLLDTQGSLSGPRCRCRERTWHTACESQGHARLGQVPATGSRIAGAALRQLLATDKLHQTFLHLCTYLATAAARDRSYHF